jgi:tRNA 5-methylaminomethyl-2-thiouridine biosynthesis bifunctional protein
VLLTLCVGDVKATLRHANFSADAVFLDGFSPQRNPDMWDAYTLKAVARLCHRGTRLATWTVAREVRDGLKQCGFEVQMVAGLPPKRDRLEATFMPAWEPRKRVPNEQDSTGTQSCLVIGAGLAGAAVAASLARRGCQVTVLDAAALPAAGASGLPAGLVVPHISSDDSLLSRLCRAGAQATWQQVQELLRPGEDYALGGVRERCLDEGALEPEHWHANAGWLKPAQLVRALLAQPGVRFQGLARVQALRRQGVEWQALDEAGQVLARASRVVVCAGFDSHALLQQGLQLLALRGQLSWGWRDAAAADASAFPETPVNGRGNFIPQVPTDQGMAWYLGSSFGRDDTDARPRDSDHLANLARLQSLLPATAQALADQFPGGASPSVQAFTAVRCSSPDRLPVLGPVDAIQQPGLWVSTAMGARGLTLAVLCGELLAAQWYGEPEPLEEKLARAMFAGRRILQPR